MESAAKADQSRRNSSTSNSMITWTKDQLRDDLRSIQLCFQRNPFLFLHRQLKSTFKFTILLWSLWRYFDKKLQNENNYAIILNLKLYEIKTKIQTRHITFTTIFLLRFVDNGMTSRLCLLMDYYELRLWRRLKIIIDLPQACAISTGGTAWHQFQGLLYYKLQMHAEFYCWKFLQPKNPERYVSQ